MKHIKWEGSLERITLPKTIITHWPQASRLWASSTVIAALSDYEVWLSWQKRMVSSTGFIQESTRWSLENKHERKGGTNSHTWRMIQTVAMVATPTWVMTRDRPPYDQTQATRKPEFQGEQCRRFYLEDEIKFQVAAFQWLTLERVFCRYHPLVPGQNLLFQHQAMEALSGSYLSTELSRYHTALLYNIQEEPALADGTCGSQWMEEKLLPRFSFLESVSSGLQILYQQKRIFLQAWKCWLLESGGFPRSFIRDQANLTARYITALVFPPYTEVSPRLDGFSWCQSEYCWSLQWTVLSFLTKWRLFMGGQGEELTF